MPNIPLPSIAVRQWLYGVIAAALALLVGLRLLDPTAVPLWLTLATALLSVGGHATAAYAAHSQIQAGEVEPGKHSKPE
jgi:hypothetical protein